MPRFCFGRKQSGTLLFLSSGARPRYRDDIVRTLALPCDGRLQFRYDKKFVADQVQKQVSSRELIGKRVLICYIFAGIKGAQTNPIPCRFGEITGARVVGSSFIFEFRVGDFVSNLSWEDLKKSLAQAELLEVPKWEKNVQGAHVLEGKFAFSVSSEFNNCHSADVIAFESTVRKLVQFSDFSNIRGMTFYSIRSLNRCTNNLTGREICLRDGVYKLKTADQYEIEIYCYYPLDHEPLVQAAPRLVIQSETTSVEFPLGNSLPIDSNYDLKRFVFRVGNQINSVNALLRIAVSGLDETSEPHFEIIVPVKFKGSRMLLALRLCVVATGTAAPAMVADYTSSTPHYGLYTLMLAFGFVAALGTIFKLSS